MRDVEVRLVRGAKLRMRYDGTQMLGTYSLFSRGLPISVNALERGGTIVEPVLPGAIEVHWSDVESKITKVQSVTVRVGEVQELVWDGRP